MIEQQHSELGASSMYRWQACPGSVALCRTVPPLPSSEYALEGTRAHDLSYQWISSKFNSFLAPVNLDDWPEDMVDAVRVLVDHVSELLSTGKFRLYLEQPVSIPMDQVTDVKLFGTADVILHSDDITYVIDYKHGQHMYVSAEDNSQLLYYAVGAQMSLGLDIKTMVVQIVQPRCGGPDSSIRSHVVETVDLFDFYQDIVTAVQQVESENPLLAPGDHCQFCAAKSVACPKIRETAMAQAQKVFVDVYDPEELARVLAWIPVCDSWIKDVKAFAYAEATAGRAIPGYKLVDKQSRRSWISEDNKTLIENLTAILDREGYCVSNLVERKVCSPPQAEKIIKDKELFSQLESLICRKHTGTTLVPNSDKRMAATPSIEDAFSTTIQGENK